MKRLNIQIQQRSTVPPELCTHQSGTTRYAVTGIPGRGSPLHSAVVGSPGTVSRLQHPGLRGGSLCIVWGKIRFVRIDDLHRMKLL